MALQATKNQQLAITTIDRPVAVVAGAGSGKTWVLVQRYLHLLDQGVAVENIAAITFTKKAAQEMKERLLEARPELTASLERAQISTFHSLCQRIVEEHPLQARLDPRFRVAEEWESRFLLSEVIDEVVADTEIPADFGSASRVSELVLELYEQMLRKGDLRFQREFTEPLEEIPRLQLVAAVEEALTLVPSTATQKEALDGLKAEWPYLRDLIFLPDDNLVEEALLVLEQQFKKIRGKLAEAVAPVRALLTFSLEVLREDRGRRMVVYLGDILARVHELFGERKRLGGLVDFNDLERLACELLADPVVCRDYPFTHLMVDEYQDTNPIQKQIIDAFTSQGARLFVVGDPKQSIYRFRGAEVGVFLETEQAVQAEGSRVFLDQNFRSRPELIGFCNEFFARIFAGEAITFEASKPAKSPLGRAAVTILHTEAQELAMAEARALEAAQIARQIRELVDSGSYKYKDISILFRAMSSAHIYERALREAGIPYVNLSGRGFYSKREVQDVLHYFRWLEDPGDDVAYLAVLRSPFYLVSDEGLFWLRRNRPELLQPADQAAVARAEEDHRYLSQLAKQKPAPVVICELLNRTGYVEKTWMLPFGPQKVANIEKLSQQSWDLFARGLYTIPEQIRYLRLMAQEAPKEGEAQLDAEHADVVVLRTIHSAKGLEFPVVFLADTSGEAVRSQRGQVLYHPEFGLMAQGMRGFELLKESDKAAEKSESKRLLYVAVTRAQEEFFWCARSDKRPSKESWWAWLQEHLGAIDQNLFTRLSADLAPAEVPATKGELARLERPQYAPLKPQYVQVTFSVTELMNYDRCPRYYYLRHILGLPEREREGLGSGGTGLSATERGSIVHRIVEQIRDAAELASLLEHAAAVEGIKLDSRQRNQIAEIIQPYLESEFFQRVQGGSGELYRERSFFLPAGEYTINGLVDQVFVGDGGVEVVDFKTNWITADQVEQVGAAYQVQLRLYAWAMAKEFGLPPRRAEAYFLIPNSRYVLSSELLDVDQIETWIKVTCERIIQGAEQGSQAFPPIRDCTLCPQNSYCLKAWRVGKVDIFGDTKDSSEDLLEEELP